MPRTEPFAESAIEERVVHAELAIDSYRVLEFPSYRAAT